MIGKWTLLIIDVPTHNSPNIIQLWRWFVRKLPTVFWLIVITTTCKLFRIWILDCKILSIFPLERYFKTLSHYCAFHLQFSLAIIVRFSKNIKTANKFGSRDIFGFYLIFYDFAEKINKWMKRKQNASSWFLNGIYDRRTKIVKLLSKFVTNHFLSCGTVYLNPYDFI